MTIEECILRLASMLSGAVTLRLIGDLVFLDIEDCELST